MEVVIVVSEDAVQSLREKRPSADGDRILAVISSFGVRLEPLHPDTDDPQLMPYFVARTSDDEQAARLVSALRSLKDIEGVYTKPAGDVPA